MTNLQYKMFLLNIEKIGYIDAELENLQYKMFLLN